MIDRLVRNGRLLWRAESIVAEIRLHHLMARSGTVMGAGLIAVFGLLMLNVAGFFVLDPRVGSAAAAGLVALLDFVLAGVLFAAALRARPSRELDLALEVRQLAIDELEADARGLQAEFATLRAEVTTVRNAALGFLKHPLDGAISNLVVPLAGIVIKSLRKSGGTS